MDNVSHRMTIADDNSDEVVLVCDERACGRRVVVRRSGGMVVLDQGDFFARHVGGSAGVGIAIDVAS